MKFTEISRKGLTRRGLSAPASSPYSASKAASDLLVRSYVAPTNFLLCSRVPRTITAPINSQKNSCPHDHQCVQGDHSHLCDGKQQRGLAARGRQLPWNSGSPSNAVELASLQSSAGPHGRRIFACPTLLRLVDKPRPCCAMLPTVPATIAATPWIPQKSRRNLPGSRKSLWNKASARRSNV